MPADGWMGALRQTAMLYGSLVLEWQCQSEVCRHNNDRSKLPMQSLTADMLVFHTHVHLYEHEHN